MDFDYGNRGSDGQFQQHPTIRDGEFVRPIRRSYVHTLCGTATCMSDAIAETYARNPTFYTHTFCVKCRNYFLVREFEWDDGSPVGS